MTRLQGDKLEISACTVEENVRNRTPPEDQSINLELVEYILPTRLINETFSGIMNFIKVTKVGDTPRKEIQKSLVSHVRISSNPFSNVHVKSKTFYFKFHRNICTVMWPQQNVHKIKHAKLKLMCRRITCLGILMEQSNLVVI